MASSFSKSRFYLLTLIIFLFLFFLLKNINNTYAYYGMSGGLYSQNFGGWPPLGGLYNNLSLYGLGTYGRFPGLYGLGGTSLYLPGFFNGLYGFLGTNGLGLYGLGGLGLYSLTGLYGLGNLGGIFSPNLLAGFGNNRSQIPPGIVSSPAALQAFAAAEQAGSWEGDWSSLLKSQMGAMSLELVENPATGELSGTCNMLLNKYISCPVDVSGTLEPEDGTFILSGTYFNLSSATEYSLELKFTLATPESISGQYIIHDLQYTKADIGKFSLSLITPAISTPATIPTPTAPTTLIPPLLLPPFITPTLGALPTGFTGIGISPTLTTPPVVTSPVFIPTIYTPTVLFPTGLIQAAPIPLLTPATSGSPIP